MTVRSLGESPPLGEKLRSIVTEFVDPAAVPPRDSDIAGVIEADAAGANTAAAAAAGHTSKSDRVVRLVMSRLLEPRNPKQHCFYLLARSRASSISIPGTRPVTSQARRIGIRATVIAITTRHQEVR